MTRQPFFDEYFSDPWVPDRSPRERTDVGAHASIVRATQEDLDRRDRRRAADSRREGRTRMWLATEALWDLVRDPLGLTDDDLRAAIAEVESRNRAAAASAGPGSEVCANCGAPAPTDGPTCGWCRERAWLPRLFP